VTQIVNRKSSMPGHLQDGSKLPSTLLPLTLRTWLRRKIRSAPIIAGYLRSSAASSGVMGTYRTLPPFSFARTAISSSRYNKSPHAKPKISAMRIPVVNAISTISRQPVERLIDHPRPFPAQLLVQRFLQPGKLVGGQIALPLVIGSLDFTLVRWIPINAGFLRPDGGRPIPSCGA